MGDDVCWLDQLSDGMTEQAMDWEWESDSDARSSSPATSASSWTSLAFELTGDDDEDDNDDPICLHNDNPQTKRESRKPERQRLSPPLPRKLPPEQRTAMKALVNEAVQEGRAHLSKCKAASASNSPEKTPVSVQSFISVRTPSPTSPRIQPQPGVASETPLIVYRSKKPSILKLKRVEKSKNPDVTPPSSPKKGSSLLPAYDHFLPYVIRGKCPPILPDSSFWLPRSSRTIILKTSSPHTSAIITTFPCTMDPSLNNPFLDVSK